MTNNEPSNSQNDDGFVSVTQQASESYAPAEPSYQSSTTYSSATQQPVKKKTNTWLIVGIITLIVFCCCCVLGGLGYLLYYQGYSVNDFTQLLPLLNVI